MMKYLQLLVLFVSTSLVLTTGNYAQAASVKVDGVFKFQQKLAVKGNAGAQYKLACMYEHGSGVAQDIEQAKIWYDKAASAGVKAASDRRTYLSIKESGYDKAKNLAWIASIKSDANESKGDAMFLLAQLYRQGIGVKKDLNKSLEMLDRVSLLGAADVDDEISLIQSEIAAKKQAKIKARKKAKAAKGEKKAPSVENEVAAAKRLQAEKLRHYEKVMMQLKREQQQIDEQQKWAAGSASSTDDDEI